MEIDTNVLNERMNNLISTNKKEHSAMLTKLNCIDKKFDNLGKKFPTRVEFSLAGDRIKNIENVLKGAAGTVMVVILGALLKLIIK